MANLPITHITLYKHGVGFFERRARLEGEEVELSFRVAEMNDILKSLTVIDWGGGQVLGIDYATPQSREERLAGNSIRLGDKRSLRDLLIGLRGRVVALDTNIATIYGRLIGVDEPSERHPLDDTLVSILVWEILQEDFVAELPLFQEGEMDIGDDLPIPSEEMRELVQDEILEPLTEHEAVIKTLPLGEINMVVIQEEQGADDLRFFLDTALTQEDYRSVTIRLTPGEHDLAVSYIAPAPTWRVSYRLVIAEAEETEQQAKRRALLLGWGIFDNRLEEDLKGISLALVAGMPISFVYDLYTPFTPERPVVEEEARVAAAPVEFESALKGEMAGAAAAPSPAVMRGMELQAARAPAPRKASFEDFAAAQEVSTSGETLGELFQYTIQTPVTVGRGHSAMVPIVSASLTCRKDLLYNRAKMETHPVATLRLKNESGLTLERGPVTVIDDGEYVGEALLPFTATGGEIVVPYAVELGVRVQESSSSSREVHSLHIKEAYLQVEEWHIRRRTYRASNQTAQPQTVLIEHPRDPHYDIFDSPAPLENTDTMLRFSLEVPAWEEARLVVKERRLLQRREELSKQSHKQLQRYLQRGLLDRHAYDYISKLLMLYDSLENYQKDLREIEEQRAKIFKAQKQIHANMEALSTAGKERVLRSQYVDRLEETEQQLRALARQEEQVKENIAQVEGDLAARLENGGE